MAVGAIVFEENPPKALDYQIKAGDKGSLKSVALLSSVFRDGMIGYEKESVRNMDDVGRAALFGPRLLGARSLSEKERDALLTELKG
ncbi:MAG: hypothetical protein ACRCXK_08795 [Wohlfahrtiimonas sp.]